MRGGFLCVGFLCGKFWQRRGRRAVCVSCGFCGMLFVRATAGIFRIRKLRKKLYGQAALRFAIKKNLRIKKFADLFLICFLQAANPDRARKSGTLSRKSFKRACSPFEVELANPANPSASCYFGAQTRRILSASLSSPKARRVFPPQVRFVPGRLFFFRRERNRYKQVFQLLFRNGRRRLRHEVLPLLRFRECDNVANRRAVCENRD